MPEKKFELGDYVEVKDRIAILYELYPQARLVTGDVTMHTAPDGKQRIQVQAFAYRTPDDPHPGVGHSWMELPGSTPYTKGSELENTETSAWGRAIASLGILIDRSIASAQEVANKEGGPTPARPKGTDVGAVVMSGVMAGASTGAMEARAMRPYDPLIGTVELAKDSLDFLPHQGQRDGVDVSILTFKLTSTAGGIKVIAYGQLAEALSLLKGSIIGQRVSCWGRIRDETFTKQPTKAGGKPFTQTYQVLDLERIQTPDVTLPAADEGLPEPPEDVSLIGEKPEAETAQLGLVS